MGGQFRDDSSRERTIFGVRLKVMPWMSVGMELKKPSGRAMVRGSVLTRPWSSNCSTTTPIQHRPAQNTQLHNEEQTRTEMSEQGNFAMLQSSAMTAAAS